MLMLVPDEVVREDVVSVEDRVASDPIVVLRIRAVQKRESISRKVDRQCEASPVGCTTVHRLAVEASPAR